MFGPSRVRQLATHRDEKPAVPLSIVRTHLRGGTVEATQRRRGENRNGSRTAPRDERHAQVDRSPAPNGQLEPRLQPPVRRKEGGVQKVRTDPFTTSCPPQGRRSAKSED